MPVDRLEKYREATSRMGSMAGVMRIRRRCSACRMEKDATGGKLKWIGKQQFFTCADCVSLAHAVLFG